MLFNTYFVNILEVFVVNAYPPSDYYTLFLSPPSNLSRRVVMIIFYYHPSLSLDGTFASRKRNLACIYEMKLCPGNVRGFFFTSSFLAFRLAPNESN